MGLFEMCEKLRNNHSMLETIMEDGYLLIYGLTPDSKIKVPTHILCDEDSVNIVNSESIDITHLRNYINKYGKIIVFDSNGRKKEISLDRHPIPSHVDSIVVLKDELQIGMRFDD